MTGSLHNQTPPNEVFTVQQVLNKASGKDIWLCFNIVDPAECISELSKMEIGMGSESIGLSQAMFSNEALTGVLWPWPRLGPR